MQHSCYSGVLKGTETPQYTIVWVLEDNAGTVKLQKVKKKLMRQATNLCFWNSQVEAVDLDADINAQIKYSIDFGNQQRYFSINESTGAITLTEIIPLEAHQTEEFLLFITATDGRSLQCPAAMCILRSLFLDYLLRNLIFHFQEVLCHVPLWLRCRLMLLEIKSPSSTREPTKAL